MIQSNDFNQSKIQTVILVVMTSNLRLAAAPGNVLCRAKDTGLPKDSVANISQLVTIDKSFLTHQVGSIPSRVFEQIEQGLRLVLNSENLAVP